MNEQTNGELLGEEWASELEYWVDIAVKALTDPKAEYFGMAYNKPSFEKVRLALSGAIEPNDLHTFLADFAGGILWSLQTSFEQGPFHVKGPKYDVVVRETRESVASGDDFMGAMMRRGLMK